MNDVDPNRKISWVGWLGILVLFCLGYFFLLSGSMKVLRTDATLNKLQASGHDLINGVKLYASQHQGKYPHSLVDLVSEKVLEDQRILDKLLSHPIERPEKPLGWIYLPDRSDNTPPDYPVLFTPTLRGDTGSIVRKLEDIWHNSAHLPETPTRLVFCYNGSGSMMSEPEFQALLKTHNITLPAVESVKAP